MSEEKKQVRFGHCEGYTDVCFDDSGRYLLSCGTDGDVRIWDGFQDDNPVSHSVGECAHAVSFKGGRFFVGADTNAINAYTFPDGQPDGIVTRFTSQPTHVDCSKNFLAAGAGDFAVKVVNLKDSSQKIFQGHSAPVLSVAFDPKEEFVASSGCDGTVRLWKFADGESVKIWNLLPKSNDFCLSKTLGRICWFPASGKCLVIPVDSELQIYERNSWNVLYKLKDDFCSELLSLSSFSNGGRYLAAAGSSGKILVWEFNSRSCVERETHEEGMICGLVWSPRGEDTLVFTDFHGQLGMLTNVGKMDDQKELKGNSQLSDVNSDSYNKIKLTNEAEATSESKSDVDDEDVDIGAIKATYNKRIFLDDNEDPEEETKPTVEEAAPRIRAVVPQTLQQSAFQPGSTPAHLEHRFMIWNTVGLVRCYNTDDESSLDVEFHDTTLHHALHINNTLNHTMCDLSSEALLLACPEANDEKSKVVCMHFATWDSNKEWKAELPEGEETEAVTLGKGWAAVATSKQFLRLFTIGGIQGSVVSIPGPVVCLSSMEDILLVVYHQAAGLSGHQCLGLIRYNVKVQSILSASTSQPLPLSAKSVLAWLGFTDEGTPCTVDLDGVVRLRDKGGVWIPVTDTKAHTKGKSDHYFVVGLSEIQQQIRCIPCKGSRYPPTLPHPSVAVLPFKLPLCDLTSDKGKLEEEYWRLENLNRLLKKLTQQDYEVDRELEDCEKKKVETLLRMFALSTRNHKEFQALEIAKMMPNTQVVQGAIRYATQRHAMTLAEKLSEVAHEKLNEEQSADEQQAETEDDELCSFPCAQITRHSNAPNEPVIQPKSLAFSRRSIVEQEFTEPEETEGEPVEENSNGMTALKTPSRKNPFKTSSQQKKQNSVGMDGILQDSMEQAAKRLAVPDQQQKLKPARATLNGSRPSPPTVSAAQLYVQEMKAELAAENPELDDDDIAKLAVQQFKKLPADEKQKWQKKAKETAGSTKKRKSATMDQPDNKKPKKEVGVCETTSCKLTQFMFEKK